MVLVRGLRCSKVSLNRSVDFCFNFYKNSPLYPSEIYLLPYFTNRTFVVLSNEVFDSFFKEDPPTPQSEDPSGRGDDTSKRGRTSVTQMRKKEVGDL